LAFMAVLLLIMFVALMVKVIMASAGKEKPKEVIEGFPGLNEELESKDPPDGGGMVH